MRAPQQAPREKDYVLVVENVSKTFQTGAKTVKALDKVSARVQKGLVTGLIGPDGSGKTTLLRLISGLLLPNEGILTVLGSDVVKNPLKVQASIRYMPQRFGLYEDLTVKENLDLYADLQGLLAEERPEHYKELMHMTGLGPFTKRLAGDLSGGMKQKLGLACTLLRPAELLLLDEATVGVDPVSRRELWSIVYRMVESKKMTVILSTAYLDEAERCDEVILIHEGKVLGQGDPGEFTKKMEGRSFQAGSPTMKKRTLQKKMMGSPGVIDAIVHAGGVRLVMDEAKTPTPDGELPGLEDVNLVPVPPRFEDSFISLLKKDAESSMSSFGDSVQPSESSADEEVILVRDVKRRFGDFYAVKGISFKVGRGEVFGLLGANGAGKSTTFRMLCGLLPATEGTLNVAGQDLRRAAAKARAHIGYMAQRFSLYANLTVLENLRFFSSVYGLRGKHQHSRIQWAIGEFELDKYADSKSGDLALGYKQRLALAATLMHQPEILFLDEPTSGVDPVARREFWRRISALADRGVTVLVTTHFMEEAEYCDRLVIMADGEILAEGTPERMKEDFRTPERPEPTMEDAFIGLIEAHDQEKKEAAS